MKDKASPAIVFSHTTSESSMVIEDLDEDKESDDASGGIKINKLHSSDGANDQLMASLSLKLKTQTISVPETVDK